jgi:hypothetical protein
MTETTSTDIPVAYATKRLIDSVWTLGYKRVSPTEVEIVSYDRENPIGYEQEGKLDLCNTMETLDGNRVVTHVALADYKSFDQWASLTEPRELLKVVNPQHVFSYSR